MTRSDVRTSTEVTPYGRAVAGLSGAISITPGHPMPLVSKRVDLADDRWATGPWRLLRKAALGAGWSTTGLFARGWTLDARGGVGPLTDALAVRFARNRTEDGDTDRAVALWMRPTWPVLGRTPRGQVDGQADGEGRPDTTGRLWTWHPPMTPPEDGVPMASWKLDQAWTWTTGRARRRCNAADVREWITRTP